MTLNYVSLGEGTPVLAVHGWSPDHRSVLGWLERALGGRPGYRRLYPDLPGMGKSPAGPEINGSADMLAALSAFVDERIGAEPFLLVGESYGGYLARGLAAARPDQVRGLALICPIGTAVDRSDRRLPDHVVLRSTPGLLDDVPSRIAEEYADLAVVQTPETLDAFREHVVPGLVVADHDAMNRVRRDWTLPTGPEAGAPYERPTVILTARQDNSVGYLDQYDLLPHYPRATFAVLDRAGHLAGYEQPALVDALLTDWLTRTEADD